VLSRHLLSHLLNFSLIDGASILEGLEVDFVAALKTLVLLKPNEDHAETRTVVPMIHFPAVCAFDGCPDIATAITHRRLLLVNIKSFANIHVLVLGFVKERDVVDLKALSVEVVALSVGTCRLCLDEGPLHHAV
jgi:hypothetical protein